MSGEAHETARIRPWSMSLTVWRQVVLRSWRGSTDDNIGLAAAGVAFYGFLALVPMLGAIVLSYGIVAEPSTVLRNIQQLTSVMPAQAAKLIGAQLMNVVETSGGKKGFGLMMALAVALFGARNGAGAIVTALNIAFEEKEKRNFLTLNLLALAITGAAVAVAVVATVAIAALGYLQDLLPQLPTWASLIGKVGSYLLLACTAAAAAATLYRFGPAREEAKWVWVTPGSMFTAASWLILTLGFGAYVANFGNYDATYGSLGTVVVLLTWLYLCCYLLLFGAELNSEFEHQASVEGSARQTTRERGTVAADHPPDRDAPFVALQPPAPRTTRPPTGRSPVAEDAARYAVARATSRVAQVAGFGKTDMLSSSLSSLGLTRIRRSERPLQGLALLAAAAALAWLRRSAPKS